MRLVELSNKLRPKVERGMKRMDGACSTGADLSDALPIEAEGIQHANCGAAGGQMR